MIKYDNKNPWINKKLKADIVLREKLLIISKKITTELNIQKYKIEILQIRELQKEHIIKNNSVFLVMILKKSFRVLRKLICKDNGHNMTNSNDFIIDKSIV